MVAIWLSCHGSSRVVVTRIQFKSNFGTFWIVNMTIVIAEAKRMWLRKTPACREVRKSQRLPKFAIWRMCAQGEAVRSPYRRWGGTLLKGAPTVGVGSGQQNVCVSVRACLDMYVPFSTIPPPIVPSHHPLSFTQLLAVVHLCWLGWLTPRDVIRHAPSDEHQFHWRLVGRWTRLATLIRTTNRKRPQGKNH